MNGTRNQKLLTNVEQELYDLVGKVATQEHTSNSNYIRDLIIRDLMIRQLINEKTLLAMAVS